ncbi:hypothetical protein DFH08DRAFT_968488 [Mycena albidolilacea]|uniref:Uncharacterized protein n=1 Tax=Mycena albidolilacea TaxID=1033008 RepID=A0AAD6ZJ60_9AGAR|nr:hypothetical protein DFH08DRAFT_968488 [Mycena albidolilacea]
MCQNRADQKSFAAISVAGCSSTLQHDVTPEERAALVQTLLSHVHRIRKLFIRHGILEPEGEDETTILRLFNAGLEFTALEENTHEHRGQGFQPSPESDMPLNLTAPKLRSLSIDGIRPRAWSTLVLRSLVELDIVSKGTPFDMNLLSMIFQQCRGLASLKLRREFFHNHVALAAPAPHPRFVPPLSLRALDLYMPMSEILTVLSLLSSGSPLPAITICDEDGLCSMTHSAVH